MPIFEHVQKNFKKIESGEEVVGIHEFFFLTFRTIRVKMCMIAHLAAVNFFLRVCVETDVKVLVCTGFELKCVRQLIW